MSRSISFHQKFLFNFDPLCRSAYYTLLKWDVLQSGKFALDLDKCISLAAYQLQIEVPDNKPTIPYLKMLNLLPSVWPKFGFISFSFTFSVNESRPKIEYRWNIFAHFECTKIELEYF